MAGWLIASNWPATKETINYHGEETDLRVIYIYCVYIYIYTLPQAWWLTKASRFKGRLSVVVRAWARVSARTWGCVMSCSPFTRTPLAPLNNNGAGYTHMRLAHAWPYTACFISLFSFVHQPSWWLENFSGTQHGCGNQCDPAEEKFYSLWVRTMKRHTRA